MTRDNPPRPKCPVCRTRKEPTTLLCSACYRAFDRIKVAPGESAIERLCRLADWAIRRAVRLERAMATATAAKVARGNEVRANMRAKMARSALDGALLGIQAATVEEYREQACALAMNWKLEE